MPTMLVANSGLADRTSHHKPTSSHPDPLRSHSTEYSPSFMPFNHTRSTSQLLRQTDSTESLERPDSPTWDSARQHRHRRTLSQRAIGLPPTWQLPSLPIHPAHRSFPAERLGDRSMASTSDSASETDVITVTPKNSPPRSKVSFGGVSRFSYYSDVSSALDQKSKDVAAAEELAEKGDNKYEFEAPMPTTRTCRILLCLLSFAFGLSTSCLAASLPTLSQSLGIDSVQSFWLIGSFLTSKALMQPLWARLTDVSGPNSSLLLGCLTYAIGSVIGAGSQSYSVLLFGRCLEGAGNGIVTAATLTLLHQSSGPGKETRSSLSISTCNCLGVALGPIVGAASPVAWRGVLGTNACIAFIAFAVLPFLLSPPDYKLRRPCGYCCVDYLGWALLSSSIVGLLVALSWGGSSYAWTSEEVLAPLVICLLGFASWVLYAFYRVEGAVPVQVFRHGETLLSCIGSLVLGMLYIIILHLVPLYFMAVKRLQPVIAAAVLGSWTLSMMSSYLIGAALPSLSSARYTQTAAWALLAATLGCSVILHGDTPAAASVPIGLVAGSAIGLLHSSFARRTLAANQAEIDPTSSQARQMHSFAHSLGQAIGLVIGSSIFLNVFDLKASTLPGLGGNLPTAIAAAGTTLLAPSSMKAYTIALSAVWIFCCVLASLAFLISAITTIVRALRGNRHADTGPAKL